MHEFNWSSRAGGIAAVVDQRRHRVWGLDRGAFSGLSDYARAIGFSAGAAYGFIESEP
jgi:hypothetical protein